MKIWEKLKKSGNVQKYPEKTGEIRKTGKQTYFRNMKMRTFDILKKF